MYIWLEEGSLFSSTTTTTVARNVIGDSDSAGGADGGPGRVVSYRITGESTSQFALFTAHYITGGTQTPESHRCAFACSLDVNVTFCLALMILRIFGSHFSVILYRPISHFHSLIQLLFIQCPASSFQSLTSHFSTITVEVLLNEMRVLSHSSPAAMPFHVWVGHRTWL